MDFPPLPSGAVTCIGIIDNKMNGNGIVQVQGLNLGRATGFAFDLLKLCPETTE